MTKYARIWILTVDDGCDIFTNGFTSEREALRWLWNEYGTGEQPDDLAAWATGDEDTGCIAPGCSVKRDCCALPVDDLQIVEVEF